MGHLESLWCIHLLFKPGSTSKLSARPKVDNPQIPIFPSVTLSTGFHSVWAAASQDSRRSSGPQQKVDASRRHKEARSVNQLRQGLLGSRNHALRTSNERIVLANFPAPGQGLQGRGITSPFSHAISAGPDEHSNLRDKYKFVKKLSHSSRNPIYEALNRTTKQK